MKYPEHPGHKGIETSKAAANAVAGRAPVLRTRCLEVIKERGPLAADEVATILGEDKLAIRPRIAELHLMGKLADAGQRVRNDSGRFAARWVAVRPAPEQFQLL